MSARIIRVFPRRTKATPDARALADICERALRKFPSQAHLANLIMALRYGADQLEAA